MILEQQPEPQENEVQVPEGQEPGHEPQRPEQQQHEQQRHEQQRHEQQRYEQQRHEQQRYEQQRHEQQRHEQQRPEQAEPETRHILPVDMTDEEYCEYLRFMLNEFHAMQRETQGIDVGVQSTVRKAMITFIEGELELTQMFSALLDEFDEFFYEFQTR